MINKLKTNYKDLSKDEVIEIIKQYVKENKDILLQDNFDNTDFDSPSWALKQALNMGSIKTLTKLENFLKL